MRILGVISAVLALLIALAVGGTFAAGYSQYDAAKQKADKQKSRYSKLSTLDREGSGAFALAPLLAADGVALQKRTEKSCRKANSTYKKRRRKYGSRSSRTSKAKKSVNSACKKALNAYADLGRDVSLASLLSLLGLLIVVLGGVLAALRKGRAGGALMLVGALVPLAAGVGAFITTGIFVLLGALLLVLGFLAARGGRSGDAEPPPPESDTPPVNVVLRADVTHKRLRHVMEQDFGFTYSGGNMATQPLIPGEPEIASWTKGGTHVTYAFNPVVYLRELEIRGNDLSASLIASKLPVANAETVREDLGSGDEATQMRGLMTAERLELIAFTTEAHRLTRSPSDHVSSLAQKVCATLKAKGGTVEEERTHTPAGPLDPRPPSTAPVSVVDDAPTMTHEPPPDPEAARDRLIPRSMEEKFLYMELHPCPTCGDTRFDRSNRLVARGADMVSVESGPCVRCGTERKFEFVLPEEALMQGSPIETYGGDAPSTIIDPGQFLALSDTYAKRTHPPPEQLDAAGRKEAFEDLMRAIVAMEEVLKFIGPGAMDQPEESAFFSEESAKMRAEMPGQFKRYRLEARLGTYKRIAKMYE